MIKYNGTIMPIALVITAIVVGAIVGIVIKRFGPSLLATTSRQERRAARE